MTIQDDRRRLHELIDAAPPQALGPALRALHELMDPAASPASGRPEVPPAEAAAGTGAALLEFTEGAAGPDDAFAGDVMAARRLLTGGVSAEWSDGA